MPWKHDKSLERITSHLADLDERGISVSKLTRKTEDLESLLSETECREIYGAHVYGAVTNFSDYSSAPITQSNDFKKFLRSANVYQVELAYIIEQLFGGHLVHFQGDRYHALLYRPIDDPEAISKRAVLLQLASRNWVESVFNPYAKFTESFKLASGGDIGTVIGTRNGPYRERELLFLGPAANNAAKILAASSTQITKAVYEALPQAYRQLCKPAGTSGTYNVSCSTDVLDALLAEEEIPWNRDALRKRLEDRERSIPLDQIEYSGASDPIDFSCLSILNSKRVLAATVYADVDGFTAYIASKTTSTEKEAALRVFHAIRRESGRTGRSDYQGVQVQFQGDRIQLVVNVPKDDEAGIALEAVEIAVALNTAMETTLREALGNDMTLHYGIGVDMGTTLATRFGARGDRDNICLGSSVANAATLQEKLARGKQVVISTKVYQQLPDTYAKHFAKIDGHDAYRASGLTLKETEKARSAAKYATIGIVGVAAAAGLAIAAAARESRKPEPLPPPKSWLP